MLDCPSNYFLDLLWNICRQCDSSCISCNGPTSLNCTACPSHFYAYDNECNPCIKEGICNQCLICHPICKTCNGPTSSNCLSCRANEVLYQGNCLSTCPGSTYLNTEASFKTCESCDYSCLTCYGSSSSNCLSCFYTFFYYDNHCIPHCPKYFVEFIDSSNSATCTEICGDAKRFNSLPYCDDGNIFDGDGCSSICQVEQGWECFGGGSQSRDNCTKNVIITPKLMIYDYNAEYAEIIFNIPISNLTNETIQGIIGRIKDIDETYYNINFENQSNQVISINLIYFTMIKNRSLEIDLKSASLFANNDSFITTYFIILLPDFYYQTPSEKKISAASYSATSNATITLTYFAIVPLVFGLKMHYLWSMIYNIQTTSLLIFIDIDYPANFANILQGIKHSKYGFNPSLFVKMLDYFRLNSSKNTKFERMGMDLYFLRNIGGLLSTLTIYTAIRILYEIMIRRKWFIHNRLLSIIPSKLKQMTSYTSIVRVILLNKYIFLISIFIQTIFVNYSKFYLGACTLISFISFCGLITWTIKQIRIIQERENDPFSEVEEEHFFDEYKMTKKWYGLFDIIKAIISCALIIILENQPLIIIIGLTSLNFFDIFLIIKYQPYNENIKFIISYSIINQLIHIGCLLCAFNQKNQIMKLEDKIFLGWILIGLICFGLLLNIVEFIFILIKKIAQKIKSSATPSE